MKDLSVSRLFRKIMFSPQVKFSAFVRRSGAPRLETQPRSFGLRIQSAVCEIRFCPVGERFLISRISQGHLLGSGCALSSRLVFQEQDGFLLLQDRLIGFRVGASRGGLAENLPERMQRPFQSLLKR